MAYQYFKDVEDDENNEFTFTAVGNPTKSRGVSPAGIPKTAGDENSLEYPYATLNGVYIPMRHSPNFDNDTSLDTPNSTRVTGLSQHALRKAKGQVSGNNTPDDISHAEIRKDLMLRHTDADENYKEHLEKVNSGFYDKKEQDALKRASVHPYFQQDTLFDTHPSTLHINNMFADPSMTKSAITLGALAKKHYNPEVIESSSDLSKFSSKLVKNGIKRGLLKADEYNPTAMATNTIQMAPRTIPSEVVDKIQNIRISEHEVTAAKADLRETLRGSKNQVVRKTTPVTPKGLGHQFLPGMQGFA